MESHEGGGSGGGGGLGGRLNFFFQRLRYSSAGIVRLQLENICMVKAHRVLQVDVS